MKIKINTIGTKDVIRKLNQLKGQSESALKKVVNDFKRRAPGWIAKDITQTYNAKKKDVKGSMRSQGEGLDAEVNIHGRVLSLAHFGLKPKERPRKMSYPVSAEIFKGNRSTYDRLTTFVHNGTAFTRRDESGQIVGQVVGKDGKKHNYFRILDTLSVPQMAGNEDVSKAISEDVNKQLMKRAEHYLKYYLNK